MGSFIQRRKDALLVSHNIVRKKVLSKDYVLRGKTSYTYSSEDGKSVSYLYPKEFHTTAENNVLSFSVSDTLISFPVDEPLYNYSVLYDTFCFKDGKWGIEKYFSTVSYDGTEDWTMVSAGVFAIKKPDNIANVSTNNHLRWIDSTITSSNTSFNNISRVNNCIALGTEYIAFRLDSSVNTLDNFKAVLLNLSAGGTPLTVFYEFAESEWRTLPDNIQKYLSYFTI